MAFPCNHKTHGPYYNLNDIINPLSALSLHACETFPYHVRLDPKVQWQKMLLCIYEKEDHGYCCIRNLHLTENTGITSPPCFCFQIIDPLMETYESSDCEKLLIDEVDKKLYFVHFPDNDQNNYVFHKASVEINTEMDVCRYIENPHSMKLYLGQLDSSMDQLKRNAATENEKWEIKWLLSPYDGSIFQIVCHVIIHFDTGTADSYYAISRLKLDDSVKIEGPLGLTYDGKVKVIAQCKFEFDRQTYPDPGFIFSENGRKLLIRFRFPNIEVCFSDLHKFDELPGGPEAREFMETVDLDHPMVSQMNKPPIYVLFGIDQSKGIELLTQFKPTSYENHCDLLVSSRLLATFGDYIQLPNCIVSSFVSQRTNMIGQFLKYTFFSAIHKNKMVILTVKSLPKTLQSRNLTLTSKKLWFPLEDEKFKEAFQKLSNLIKWEMLSEKDNNLFVTGQEFVLEVRHKFRHLATVRVKLGGEYKDYRKCASCGKVEESKRRNKNGKRVSNFKVCGWCKDHGLHKLWWERPCHYCSEKCADDHWPIHQLQHENQKIKGKKGKGKKKNKKNK